MDKPAQSVRRTSGHGIGRRRPGWLCRRHRWIALPLALIVAGHPAFAVTLVWIDPGGGSAGTTSNWNPAQVPTSSDDCTFALNNTYAVSWSTVSSSRSHLYTAGTVSATTSGSHTFSQNLTVGGNATPATLRLTTGQFLPASVVLGGSSGFTGTLEVTDDDAFLTLNGATTTLTVGQSGTGNLNVTGGGSVFANNSIIAGSNTTGTGTISVSGFDATSLVPSSITTSAGDIVLGEDGGSTATMTVSNGATGAAGRDLVVAPMDTGNGSFVVEAGGGSPATFYVQRNLEVGHNATIFDGGDASVTVNDGGSLFVTGTTNVGDLDGISAAFLAVNSGGYLETTNLEMMGGFTFTGGTVRINGGTYDPLSNNLTIRGPGNPVMEFIGGSTSLSQTMGLALQVGGADPGTLRIKSGGQVIVGGGTSDASFAANATFLIDTNGTYNGDRNTSVVGPLTVNSGGRFEGFNLTVSGTTTMSGTSSSIEADNVFTNSGTYSMSGGSLTAGSANNSGSMTVATTTPVTVTSTFTNSGSITSSGSLITAGTLDFNGSGSLLARGTVNAKILMDSPTASITTNFGALTIGNAADPNGFFSTGTTNVGSNTLTMNDSNGAVVGNVTIANGTLTLPVAGTLAAGTSISGNGTINGGLNNSGSLLPAGGGLRFAGALNGVGQAISGTKITFLSTGSFSGTGTIDADVDIDAGATVTPTGPLTLGLTADTTGFVSDGLLAVGSRTVTVRDADAALMGNVTLAGGTLNLPAAGGTLAAGRTLSGEGIVNGPVANSGTITPTLSGLSFDGLVTGTGQGFAGTSVLFSGSAGGFTGSGSIDAEVATKSAATITATGNLLLGLSGSTSGVGLVGPLSVGPHTVTLRDADGVILPTLTTLTGGTLTRAPAGTFTLSSGRVLQGNGFVTASTFTNQGSVRPGSTVGDLSLSGNYTQSLSGDLTVDIADNVSHDRLLVSGNASLNGTIRIQFGPSFVANAGEQYVVLDAAARTGVFTTTIVTGIPSGFAAAVLYGPSDAVVEIQTDTDNDGTPDLVDCNPADPTVEAAPGEIANVLYAADHVTLSWTSALPAAGSGTRHDVVRGTADDLPAGGSSEICLLSGTSASSTQDAAVPAPGKVFYYLVRGRNSCGIGTYGAQSDGTTRVTTICPP